MSWMEWLGILTWLAALFGAVVWVARPRELKH